MTIFAAPILGFELWLFAWAVRLAVRALIWAARLVISLVGREPLEGFAPPQD